MMAAAYQCESEPKSRPMGVIDRDADTRPTPVIKMRAPITSPTLRRCRESGTARTRAQTRYVVSSGSTSVSSRWSIDQAVSP